ncbi:MAG: aspartyl/asparaginyl beta-hydroxylase domain-containing protein [Alphaproteobacteria bacterium]|nr:aspartyl/asparaginyl beta-hydroxylase domain-containing protein [Alphaproteobacteria bacterium]
MTRTHPNPKATPESRSFAKRSFLKLPVAIDAKRLVDEYNGIPADAWGVSHWDVHCSIDVLLLRGGTTGKADDFTTRAVANAPIVSQLPYIASLLAEEGAFGGAVYAFIFRTKPNGITRAHQDDHEAWETSLRIHMPIVTNDGAVLLSEGFAKHLCVGEAWTFDNQVQHSVVNGDEVRVHMIIDVLPNTKIETLLKNATFDPGVRDPERWALTGGLDASGRVLPLVFAGGEPLTIKEKKALGLKEDGFATRVTHIGKKGRLLGVALRPADIIVKVNGVDHSALSRTALDYIQFKHEPGETVTLSVLRGGRAMDVEVRLRPDYFFSPRARLEKLMRKVGIAAPGQRRSGY